MKFIAALLATIASASAFAPSASVKVRTLYADIYLSICIYIYLYLQVVTHWCFCVCLYPTQSSTAIRAALDDLPGSSLPLPKFDPLNLANLGSDETLAWFRAAELKHSRCAMVATTGYLINAAGIHFPGMLSHDISFESLAAMKPIDAWNAVPDAGMSFVSFIVYYFTSLYCNVGSLFYASYDYRKGSDPCHHPYCRVGH